VDRLVDFLEREAATQQPTPEVLRRLVRAVMAHQGDVLQDDASVVLLQWHGGDPVTPRGRQAISIGVPSGSSSAR
jgi:hypothetical protein